MNNRGATTVLFTLIISILMLFTFSALEVGRIYMSRVKAASVVQSVRQNIMADYNRELFERYHLLFMDPTYGTGSEAVLEEKASDYIEYSLNEETGKIYVFSIDEIAVIDEENILDNDMRLLKEQIESYEKTAGILHRAKEVNEKLKNEKADVEAAAQETEVNGVELPETKNDTGKTSEKKNSKAKNEKTENKKNKTGDTGTREEVKDPRDEMKESLKFGILNFLKPADMKISSKKMDLNHIPSARYESQKEEEKDNSFKDIKNLNNFLKQSAKEKNQEGLLQKAAFLDYVDYHFSNGVNQKEDSVAKCEIEYILKGKDNDFDNLQGVVNDITWLRMPVNYSYLLTDEAKKSEALTLAAAICTATGTEALIEVVKYLLLGCWAYGETLCDMRTLLEGGKIPYTKTAASWKTDLKNIGASSTAGTVKNGLSYEDYLLILLAKKSGKKLNVCYARMLDLVQWNLQSTDDTFFFENYVGELRIQGKICVNSLFSSKGNREVYEYYFDESVAY